MADPHHLYRSTTSNTPNAVIPCQMQLLSDGFLNIVCLSYDLSSTCLLTIVPMAPSSLPPTPTHVLYTSRSITPPTASSHPYMLFLFLLLQTKECEGLLSISPTNSHIWHQCNVLSCCTVNTRSIFTLGPHSHGLTQSYNATGLFSEGWNHWQVGKWPFAVGEDRKGGKHTLAYNRRLSSIIDL